MWQAREGTKKTVWINFPEMCRSMKRPADHVQSYVFAELGTTGSIDGGGRMIVNLFLLLLFSAVGLILIFLCCFLFDRSKVDFNQNKLKTLCVTISASMSLVAHAARQTHVFRKKTDCTFCVVTHVRCICFYIVKKKKKI